MKKVLIITYYWPPAGGPGVQRVLKFVKYLREFEWDPIVMTVERGDYPAYDYELEKEIPKNLKIYKLPIWEPYNLYRKLAGLKKDEVIPVAILAEKKRISFKQKVLKSFRANLFIPDARIAWYFKAVKEGEKIINNENVNCIFVSSPPHSLQLIGKKLKDKTGLPFIGDLRDPWTKIHYYHGLKRTMFAQKIDAQLEKKVLRHADLVLTVSPQLKKDLKKIYKKTNCEVLYNGFDQSDFDELSEVNISNKFKISYIGNFKPNQNPEMLWKSLNTLINENKEFAKNLQLEFTGKVNPEILGIIEKENLMAYTVINEYLPHQKAIQKMREAAALLFIIPDASNNKGILTGKLFDYLASGKPLLSIGPNDGDAAKILKEVRAGKMFGYGDFTNLKTRILELYVHWKNGSLANIAPNFNLVKNYERRNLTGSLAALLNDIVKRKYEKSVH
jgi:glycosyltransferase involved in cell wall biosynthesis